MDYQVLLDELPKGASYVARMKDLMSPARLEHSLEVMEVMSELADCYSLDREKALTAGLLHDIAKDFAHGKQIDLVESYCLQLHHPAERHPLFLHGPIGALYLQNEWNFEDTDVLDAVYTHTYMRNSGDIHAPLNWCLRFADVLARSRTWKDFQVALAPVVFAGKIDEAALMTLKWVIELDRRLGIPSHPEMNVFLDEVKARVL